MTDLSDFVRTSKGLRHRSQVHQVQGGSHIRRDGSTWAIRTSASETPHLIAHALPPPAGQAAQGGWVSWVDWQNTTGASVTEFVASWEVPPQPQAANGQLIYLFNGLQDAQGSHIVQPVLQWGTSPAVGSGYNWGLASFWAGQATDPMFCTEWVAVASGTKVTGRMTLATQDNGLFSCTCQFDGYPQTQLTAENLPNLTDCVLTLEAYDMGASAPYPDIRFTEFNSVNLITTAGPPALQWRKYGGATVQRDGSRDGDIEVTYPTTAA